MTPKNMLFVEDNEIKKLNVGKFLVELFPDSKIDYAGSLMGGVKKVRRSSYDLIILDMTLPNYEQSTTSRGGGMHPLGGIEFLRQLKRRRIETKVIVVTQYETFGSPPFERDLNDLNKEMSVSFPNNYVGAVYYHATIADWAEHLKKMIGDI